MRILSLFLASVLLISAGRPAIAQDPKTGFTVPTFHCLSLYWSPAGGAADKKVLILTSGIKENVFLSGRNLPNVHVMPYSDVSTYHILWSDIVLIEAEALGEKLDAVEESADVKAATKKVSDKKASAPKAAKKASKPKAEAKAKPAKAVKKAVRATKRTAKKATKTVKKAAKKATKAVKRAAKPARKKAAPKRKPARKAAKKK